MPRINPGMMMLDGGEVAAPAKTTTPAAAVQPVPNVTVATAPTPVVVAPTVVTPTSVPIVTPKATPVVAVVEKPDPTKTAYADLTPAQRAAMTQQEKMDYIEAARTAAMAAEAAARAASNPLYDFANRPDAPEADSNYIYYYSFIGGATKGEWRLYRAPNTPENQVKYGARAIGGETQGTPESSVGANSLKVQPKPVKDDKGNVVSWTTTPTTDSTIATGTKLPDISSPEAAEFNEMLKGRATSGAKLTTEEQAWVTSYLAGTGKTPVVPNTVIPGSTGQSTDGGPSLAINTFKNTLSLFFGTNEMTKPWVDELYKLVNPYYKSGSSIDEAFNMAIQEGRKNPNLKEFTARFKGIYDLQDKLLSGVAVTVPTIAEFVGSQAKMGAVLDQAGLSSLNQQSYLGDIIGKGVNVTEFTNRVNDVFLRIDRLPQQAKDFISGSFPTLDRTSLAKAILGGEKGAIALSKELGGMEVQAAGKAQGLGVDTATGLDIAARGFGYKEALTGFGTVAEALPTYEKLQEISAGKDIKTSQVQTELQGMVFNKSIVDSLKAQGIAQEEINRFSSKTGNIGSRAFASQQRGAGLI